MTKEKMLITKLDDGMWSVEITDKYGDWTKVYEETIDDCRKYAVEFWNTAETRKASNDSWGECVKQMIKDDRKAGRNWE
tara:strand:+ start:662 stop:898 length:237 start_codon:yes stop_codon:yes gene_type:complete